MHTVWRWLQNKSWFVYSQRLRSKNSFLERKGKKGKKRRKRLYYEWFSNRALNSGSPPPPPAHTHHHQKIPPLSPIFCWKHNEQCFQILVTFVKGHNEVRYNKTGQKIYNNNLPQMSRGEKNKKHKHSYMIYPNIYLYLTQQNNLRY